MPANTEKGFTAKELLVLRKLTRAIGDVLSSRMKEYVTVLAPLFRPKTVFGDHLQGGAKEPAPGADQAFKELQSLYETVATAKPFSLPKELKSPLMQMTGSLELSPVEYLHVTKVPGESKTITVTRPFKSVLTYSGYTPRRLRELLADRTRNDGELQQLVLHYLAMQIVILRKPGLSRILSTLHFPLVSGRLPSFGDLPIIYIESSISTILPPEDLVIESTDLSGKDVFEEIVNVGDIANLGDPLKERLTELVTAQRDVALASENKSQG